MNSKLAMVFELILIAVYLVLVIFVIDTSELMGLILVGVATAVIFPLVLVVEKKREASKNPVALNTEVPVEGQTPAQPPADPMTPQQSVQPPVQPPQ